MKAHKKIDISWKHVDEDDEGLCDISSHSQLHF